MQSDYEKFYSDYWKTLSENVSKKNHYGTLYDFCKDRLIPEKNMNVLDVGGGSGQFMRYLGIRKATILDISDSGLDFAKSLGYSTLKGNLLLKFPVKDNKYDAAYLFEVLEHLNDPYKVLKEVNRILKKSGMLFIGQPNTPADGKHHVVRIYLNELIKNLQESGFIIEWVELIPAFNKISFSNYRMSKTFKEKMIFLIAYFLAFTPIRLRRWLAKKFPNRFALMYVIKCRKK